MSDFIKGPWSTDGESDWTLDTGGGCTYYHVYDNKGLAISIVAVRRPSEEPRLEALKSLIVSAPELYNALWEAVELSDRTLPPSGRTHERQRVYDLCLAALKKAGGE